MKLRCVFVLLLGLLCFTPQFWAQTYTVTDLGWNGSGPGGGAYGSHINNKGHVAGAGNYFTYGVEHSYLYTQGPPTDIGSLGAYPTDVYAINNSDELVGTSSTGTSMHAFLYKGGTIDDLGTLPGGSSSIAMGINDSGVIVGYSDVKGGSTHAFRRSPSTKKMQDLSTIIGASVSYALDINNKGTIVGEFNTANGIEHAFVLNGTVLTDLGVLIRGGTVNSEALHVNNAGQVLVRDYDDNISFLYSGGAMTQIGNLPGGSSSSGWGMNASAWVVGEANSASSCCEGFLYNPGAMTMTDLGAIGLGIYVGVAWDINDIGQIAVWGFEEYLLTPTVALGFPVQACGTSVCSPTNATINAVFDHSMNQAYECVAGVHSGYGSIMPFTNQAITGPHSSDGYGSCGTLYGYEYQGSGTLLGEYNYNFASKYCPTCLYYDSHPGYDYNFGYGTPIVPAVSGCVTYSQTAAGLSTAEAGHVLAIIPQSSEPVGGCQKLTPNAPGLSIVYMHLSSYYQGDSSKPNFGSVVVRCQDKKPSDYCSHGETSVVCSTCAQPNEYVPTSRTSPIGYTGNYFDGWGGVESHLHFEVDRLGEVDQRGKSKPIPVDPYGWCGTGAVPADPYTGFTGMTNFTLWANFTLKCP